MLGFRTSVIYTSIFHSKYFMPFNFCDSREIWWNFNYFRHPLLGYSTNHSIHWNYYLVGSSYCLSTLANTLYVIVLYVIWVIINIASCNEAIFIIASLRFIIWGSFLLLNGHNYIVSLGIVLTLIVNNILVHVLESEIKALQYDCYTFQRANFISQPSKFV